MSTAPPPPSRTLPLRVLVVDDSAVVRQGMLQLLSGHADVEVSVAADPLFAMERMRRLEPDVILLDLEMPRMDGLSFLRQLRRGPNPVPVVICSGYAAAGTARALEALEAGAADVVGKPRLGVRGFLEESAVLLLDTLRAAAQTRRRRPALAPLPRAPFPAASPAALALPGGARQVIAVGASTGGPEALRLLLAALPEDTPGIVVAQHMPEGFTAAFARSLDAASRLHVKEAAAGDRVQAGQVLIAPGNHHLRVRRLPEGGLGVELDQGPLVSRHRPSVNVLFESVAACAGAGAVGLLLTGMGDDGARGLLAMREAGSTTLAQDEASCVVFGMPRVAIESGAAQAVVGLPEMPAALLRACGRRAPA
ncbi:chemotaxis-specific protein-glutamate methyltransferase CheB [Aggregicoccus sp. 17bor-14]|uniref:chemotaxis-specific protein-glutamate methyltransferase CheB n=1 Tax=Myxococcaceae TaxID=31 RepID=UPI00129C3A55|nr:MULTISPECIES: chemotaxis-specific protein-glutamate methyltransferase CheB [Myxococcaceae]MBF5045104.1 chemotaxis-specific protein-glutamate methyltransferase CheB [Simulacricoccus sp. 17bor-14]MRI90846.1 chemotaxis-specific protein-glutamate methyltransferase CheB [Aggregicoccus sp. 17bor-14]